jgi:Uncharacterized protein conserved in bacteria (DUF2252)
VKIAKATKQYERWLRSYTILVEPDLALKHQRMAEDPFAFFRATFYRWMQLWPEISGDLAKAPAVLAVGDLHVENFGTWRDVEGRLIWGINDFDEAFPLPYTLDLVRLAASAHLAIGGEHLRVGPEDACSAILDGYTSALKTGGSPFVLAETHVWLRELALGKLRNPEQFWQHKMQKLPRVKHAVPASAREALEYLLPERGISYRLVHRIAGLGSLGRERYVALADWRGGKIAREAKALAPSACTWAADRSGPTEILYQAVLSCAVRCKDPFVQLRGHWIVRRLAPDCCRIELADLPGEKDETRLLTAMGQETANVHLGSHNRREILTHMRRLRSSWLHNAARAMAKAITADWQAWKQALKGLGRLRIDRYT